ncbi:NlpC/P60 family protein [Lachnospiraceae bacterium 62-35]
MKWKKFKKERISLNYTIMLLPHSQKKPIHFKMPVWAFGIIFLGLLVLTGVCLFFAGSRLQLREVRKEKVQLEQERELLALQKQMADLENEALKQEREIQEQELKDLEEKSRNTLNELKDLVERENQIRQELGLEEVSEEGERDGTDQNPGEEPAAQSENDVWNGSEPITKVASAELSGIYAANTDSFQAIQSEFAYLQKNLEEQSRRYEDYLNTIEQKKEAEAARKAKNADTRNSIVNYALQFIGNAYVYGGNNPNSGVDCSGFTKYILGNVAGVYLNRTAASQAGQGRVVSAQEAKPGDLVFYSNGSSINHVAIYIGNGQVVHASNERVGIIKSSMYYRTPVKIVNVLGD